MGFNFLLLCIGLLICFGGIYFRKVCAVLTGAFWGALLGIVIVLFMVLGGSYDLEGTSVVLLSIVVMAIISAVFDRLCAAINAFFTSAFMMLLLLLIAGMSIENMTAWLAILIISAIVSYVSYLYHSYAFIITTAFSGAFIANIGGYGLLNGVDLEYMLEMIFDGYGDIMPILLGTVILGAVGCKVQLYRIGKRTGRVSDATKGLKIKKISFDFSLNGKISSSIKVQPIMKSVQDEKILLIVPLFVFGLIPLSYRFLEIPYVVYRILPWVENIGRGVFLGSLVYFLLNYDLKFNLMVQCIYPVLYFILYLDVFIYGVDFSGIVYILHYVIIFGVLYLVAKIVNCEEVKPIVLIIVLILMNEYGVSFIRWQSIYYVDIDMYMIVRWGVIIGSVYYLYLKRHGRNIFSIITMVKK